MLFAGQSAIAPAGAQPASTGATTAGPSCTFNGLIIPISFNVSPGSQVVVKCTGLPPLHPYLFVETSMLLGIDPAAAPLFSGQIVSLSGLMALLAALPEINLLTSSTVLSGLDGSLQYTYTVPSSQPLDPNGHCPPSQLQFNSGLIGCAVAMIDLTSFKPALGSFVTQYAGFPVVPPSPTLALSKSIARHGGRVSVSDVQGATAYWWLATLVTLDAALSGGSAAPPKMKVTLSNAHTKVKATATVQVAPASYQNGVFSTPVLSGSFVVPSTISGPVTVTVSEKAAILGGLLSPTISATAPLTVSP